MVVGGGITGISCAIELAERLGSGAGVTLVESDSVLGGKIRSLELGDTRVEAGPDAFLTRTTQGVEMLEKLGLQGEITRPVIFAANVYVKGKMYAVPKGLMLGVPVEIGSFLKSASMLSFFGRLRAALDLILPKTKLASDATIASLVNARFGKEVNDILVDPMVGGINAGSTTDLSLDAVVPVMLENYKKSSSRSLARSLLLHTKARDKNLSKPPESIPFASLALGLDELVPHAHKYLLELGVKVLLDSKATSITKNESSYIVSVRSGDGSTLNLNAKGVAVATPSYITKTLISDLDAQCANKISSIEYAPVAMIIQRYPINSFERKLTGSGVLIPRTNQGVVTAITFASRKWSRLNFEDSEILRISTGTFKDSRAIALSDQELSSQVTAEVCEILKATKEPTQTAIARWPAALAQYRPFHKQLVQEIRKDLASFTGLEICGSAFDGIGIPACIESGKNAALRLLEPTENIC